MSFGDIRISRSLARLSPIPGLSADSCPCGRAFAPRFFQLHLTALTLRFTTVLVTISGCLFSDSLTAPMSGTLGWNDYRFHPSPSPTKYPYLILKSILNRSSTDPKDPRQAGGTNQIIQNDESLVLAINTSSPTGHMQGERGDVFRAGCI